MNPDDLTPEQAMREFKRMVKSMRDQKKTFIEKAEAAMTLNSYGLAQLHLSSVEEIDTRLDVYDDVYDIFSRTLP